ncbi:unnamed protein product [Chrysodeixis includens]|uniref:Uncharacterized protein n=1 Tax=Chrysodeixis includens TaxID=689277 RepID=A0A9P0C6D9_CHRIL|nr:unnamed protein product [Chrysodeixis includens]
MSGLVVLLALALFAHSMAAPVNSGHTHGTAYASQGSIAVGVISGSQFGEDSFSITKNEVTTPRRIKFFGLCVGQKTAVSLNKMKWYIVLVTITLLAYTFAAPGGLQGSIRPVRQTGTATASGGSISAGTISGSSQFGEGSFAIKNPEKPPPCGIVQSFISIFVPMNYEPDESSVSGSSNASAGSISVGVISNSEIGNESFQINPEPRPMPLIPRLFQ